MNKKNSTKKKAAWDYLKRYYPLYLMLLIPMAYIILFKYVPMYGIQIAFKKYNIFKGMGASPWVGFQWFEEAFGAKEFWAAVKNTFILNPGQQIICWPIPIILAILLTEISGSHGKLKEFTQTILYIPHFMSTVIIAGIMYQLFGATGAFYNAIAALGFERFGFLTNNWSWSSVAEHQRPRTSHPPPKKTSAPQRAPPRLTSMLNNNGSRNVRHPPPPSAPYKKCFT